MTDLRYRIAAVAAEHRFADHRTSFGDKCVCGWTSQDVSHADHLADAVIEALGMQVGAIAKFLIDGKKVTHNRYITSWEIVDE